MDAELVETQPNQQGQCPRVAGHLATDADPPVMPMGGGGHVPNHPQHGRMQAVGQVRHVGIGAIGGEQVLRQVIGTHAEEVHLGRQQVGGDRCGRHLDHDPHLHRWRCSAREQFALGIEEELASGAHLRDRGPSGT